MSFDFRPKVRPFLISGYLFLLAAVSTAKYNSQYINPYGKIQTKWEYQNPLEGDASEKNRFFLRAFELGSYGKIDKYVSYKFEFHYDNWEDFLGLNQLYLKYQPFSVGYVRVGYLEKTNFDSSFSNPKTAHLLESEGVWSGVMEDQNGFSGSDLGVLFELELEKSVFSLGAFNAYPRSAGYNPENEDDFWNNPVKNWMLQGTYRAGKMLKLYSNVQLLGRPKNQGFFITSYDPVGLAGVSFSKGFYEGHIEVAMGYNHFGVPANIANSSQLFLAWKLSQKVSWNINSKYVAGVAALFEGADPAISNKLDYTNDGRLRYSYSLFAGNAWGALSLGHSLTQLLDASASKTWFHRIDGQFSVYF